MFLNHADRAYVESLLQARNVHPEEILRLAELAAVPETVGQELVVAILQVQPAAWYVADIDDPAYLTTNIAHTPALELERRIVAGIGGAGASQYTRLYVGGTAVDAPPDPDVVHVNCLTEDMRFPAAGPRILTDGRMVPLPDSFFHRSEGYHIPYDVALTPPLVKELYRTLRPGGVLHYAPSHHHLVVIGLLTQAGFVNVTTTGAAPQTVYRSRMTRPAFIIQATKP